MNSLGFFFLFFRSLELRNGESITYTVYEAGGFKVRVKLLEMTDTGRTSVKPPKLQRIPESKALWILFLKSFHRGLLNVADFHARAVKAEALKGSSQCGRGLLCPKEDNQQAAARQPAGKLIECMIKILDGC